jgi:hemerythrin superfamily protein
MTIYEALEKDHRKLEGLLDELLQTSKAGDDRWKSVLEEVRHALVPHSRAEEAVFYNALREMHQSPSLVAHSYLEHASAEAELRTLGAAKMIDANWTSLVEKLRKDLMRHIEVEESKVFKAGREVLSDLESKQIAAAFKRLKPELVKDADSMMGSTIDLIANLMPRRLVENFRKHIIGSRKSAA